ncbi:MAG: proton-conducting transporter transmembrane domain-containing protein [Gaiellaceae bacterium]
MNFVSGALVVGVALLAAGAAAPLVSRRIRLALALQSIGTASVGASGVALFLNRDTVGAAFSERLTPLLGADPLSGFFLAALALVAVPSLVFAAGYLANRPASRALASLTGWFTLVLVALLCARDVVSFLAFWELMTVLPAAAILVGRQSRSVRRSVFVYLAVTHVGGVGVWISLLLLTKIGAFSDPQAFAGASPAIQFAIGVGAIVGFGTKAGLMPFHSWLPRAHPVAPSHISALMSGMMIKLALYGLIRVEFEWVGRPVPWVAYTLLALGGLSALGGVLYALVQHDLKRLLAFHSIENVGIIVLALGASLLLAAGRHDELAAIAFAAALFHTLNHAVFKSLLFLGAGAFERQVKSLELDRIGGLLGRMPVTGGAFMVGAVAIAGLPPLNGWASEWLTLQALLHLRAAGAAAAITGVIAAAALAATAALAAFCFIKVIGLVLLGRPRTEAAAEAVEVPTLMRAPTAFLAAACVALGGGAGVLVPALSRLAPTGRTVAGGASLHVPGAGILPALPLIIVLALLVALLSSARRARSAVAAPVWICGQPNDRRLAWTSAGFTKALRLVLEPVLRPERSVAIAASPGLVRSIEYRAVVPHLFDTVIYTPVVRVALAGAVVARRLQSGSLRLYVAYLLALVLAALVATKLGLIG